MAQSIPIDRESLQSVLAEKVAEVRAEPDYTWGTSDANHMTDANNYPVVRVAIGNCSLDTDIWDGLRNPAKVGLHPIGLRDVWAYYAANSVKNTRRDGSPNPLAMPETYEEAQEHFGRAAIICGMLPVSPRVFAAYAERISAGNHDPLDWYCKAVGETGSIVSRALSKLALSLLASDRAVIPMTEDRAQIVADMTRAEYQKGKYHGPTNALFPQNSIAVLTGLLQFGVARTVFRDEADDNGGVRRLMGGYGAIVVFDEHEPIHDPQAGIVEITPEWQQQRRALADYTNVDEQVIEERYCTYNILDQDGNSVCGKCIQYCPSGAIPNSVPSPEGEYSEALLQQQHRFSAGWLKFDFGNCCRERGQKGQLYSDFACARCVAICAAEGVTKPVVPQPDRQTAETAVN